MQKIYVFFLFFYFYFFNWDSHHARLNSHYEAWSFKKGSTKKITGYRKSVQKERTVINSRLKATKIIGQRKASRV